MLKLDDSLISFPKDRGLVFCNENHRGISTINNEVNKYKNKFDKWAILIGPEGGFSEKETITFNH